MLILGLTSGLPYTAIGGTLNAWLTTVDVKPSAIGLLSWALLAYAFKFLWAAALQGRRTPFGFNIGARRFFMAVFLALMVCGMIALTLSNPPNNLGLIGLISIFIALASASFDIVLAAWRIESARDDRHLDILSTVEQFGYRISGFLGGFVALLAADQLGWKPVFFGLSGIMALSGIGIWLAAPSTPKEVQTLSEPAALLPHVSQKQKHIATLLVLAGWALGFYLLGDFMAKALSDPETYKARDFIRGKGPIVVGVTVIWLGLVAAWLVFQNSRNQDVTQNDDKTGSVLDILYGAIVIPMVDLIKRLKWAAILVVAVVLSYRFTDLIWGGFAYPFYLGLNYGALGHTMTEVGFASKLMGVIATILGIGLGGLAMLRFGRMPVFFVGAILAALTNLLFADLAMDASFTDGFLRLTQLDHVFAAFNLDQRMARLTSVIFAENLAVGMASAASVAYVSSIVNKQYAAVQYALLASLTMLLGVLGRPTIGEIIETDGFARAFIICTVLGGIAAILAGCEWLRLSRQAKSDVA